MGSEAFDRMMERLDSEDRERIHEMAIAYGLTFDDPSWVPFAVTQMTLDEIQDLLREAVGEIGQAADRALNRIGSKAQAVSREARSVIEEQARAIEQLRATMREIEKASAMEYRSLLSGLSAQQVGKLVETAAEGIVRDVDRHLTGEKSVLAQSATTYVRKLEQSQHKFTAAIDAAAAIAGDAARQSAATTNRLLRRAMYLATGCILIYGAILVGLVLFWAAHQGPTDADTSQAHSATQQPMCRPGFVSTRR